MATSQTIQWVALPGGSNGEGADRKLRVSVFIAPRLRADAGQDILDSFPDFRDWPATVAGLTFNVKVKNGPSIPATVAGPAPESDLWAALFPTTTPVENFKFADFADRPFVTFPLREVLFYLQEHYAQAATSTDNLPPTTERIGQGRETPLASIFEDLLNVTQSGFMEGLPDDERLGEEIAQRIGAARQESADRLANPGVRRPPIMVDAGGAGTINHFAQASLFHRRLAGQKPVDLPSDAAAPQHFKDRVDFHQMLSALGDFPGLLRRLGLIVDLDIDAAALPETPNANQPGRLRVVSPERPTDVSPWTVYTAAVQQDIPLFFASGRGSPLLLNLPDQDYLLNQVDVDGAALKAINMAITLQHQQSEKQRPIEEPDRAGVPALRTGGLSLVRNGNVKDLHGGFLDARDLNTKLQDGQEVELWAEDLTRGYRMDVFDSETGQWRSLHGRISTFAPLDYAPGPFDITDEGFTQVSLTGPASPNDAPPDPTSELYVHDSLFTWDGWSLSAPRPGKSINRSPHAPNTEHPEAAPEKVPNRAMTAMRLEVTARVQPRSLPRLRFEHSYRVRVRMVDLAGQGLTPAETDALLARFGVGSSALPADALRYSRFEPAPSPILVPRTRYAEGESLERIVIRSEAGVAAADYAATDPDRYTDTDERHLAAPKAPLALVETHGLLDAAVGAQGQVVVDTYNLVTERDRASLNDPGPGVELVFKDDDPAGTVVYAIHRETQFEVPYLPDPLALGVAFMGLPGADPALPFTIQFGGPEWYQPTPFRMRLAEGTGAPEWDEAQRVLTVRLGKAEVATVRAMSLMPGGYFEMMGMSRWCEEVLNRGQISNVEFDNIMRAAAENRHWMFTPWREITLVHAVQHPLEAPGGHLDRLSAADPPAFSRAFGDTSAGLNGIVEVNFPSTVRLDLDAAWSEPRDVPSEGAPRHGANLVPMTAHVLDIALPTTGEEPLLRPEDDIMLAFRDRNRVEFDAQGERRTQLLQELRTRLAGAGLTPQQRNDLRRRLEILEQVRPHQFGDTKYRRVRYTFTGTSRFREYFPPAITDVPANISLSGQQITVDMLSSAPPDAPQVLYAIPTWRWETAADPDTGTRISIRRGGSLRVYLRRSWFSSGDGELLAAVLRGANIGNLIALGDESYGFVTAFGQDPVFASTMPVMPGFASFKNFKATAENLPLVERGINVAVAGFNVEPDEARDLWYCDIEMDTESAYFPFVRLVLARYQPHSIPHAHLSPVVLADTVQTVPDRTLTVTPVAGQAGAFTVQVSGPAYGGTRLLNNQVQPGASQMTARLEVRNLNVGDEDLGWDEVEGAASILGGQAAAGNVSVTWSGQVTIPVDVQGQRVRLVVEEREQLSAEDLPDQPSHFVTRGRLVYADVMEL